jgi:DNA mismatch endonuclease (patch repair protein)
MADVHSKAVRSFNMSRIRGKNTKPEMLVRKFLFAMGLRYRLHDRKLSGSPDLVFPKHGVVVFIHGCYWHGHEGCKYFVVPKTRTEWWVNKINRNKFNDSNSISELKKAGWKVITVWECELKSEQRDKKLKSLFYKIITN